MTRYNTPEEVKPLVSGRSFIQHSVPVPPHAYESDEYFCKFTPRVHADANLADAGAWQCQVDFLEASKSAGADMKENLADTSFAVGNLNPTVGNFTALWASEAIPERLALTAYIVEYGFIQDDVIEGAENKSESQLCETNSGLVESLHPDEDMREGTKDHIKRQLQAKMAVQLLEIDKEQGQECLRSRKDMTEMGLKIRGLDFKTLDEYLEARVFDAGCNWMMSLVCFSMGFSLNEEEKKKTAAITSSVYKLIVLVNDYFSWEKELEEYEENGSKGELTSAVFLFTKWYSMDWKESKKLVKSEIIAREQKYCEAKDDFLAQGVSTDGTTEWFNILDLAIAANFSWSMTTARYHPDAKDSYPDLRAAYQKEKSLGFPRSLDLPISINVNGLAAKSLDMHGHDGTHDSSRNSSISSGVSQRLSNCSTQDVTTAMTSPTRSSTSASPKEKAKVEPYILSVPSIMSFEDMVLEPYGYIESLPSKGVRYSLIDGLQTWYHVPEESLEAIRNIINILHSFSLMVDDIGDNSPLRQSFPSTHSLYGEARTVNSANFILMKTVKLAQSLSSAAVSLLVERLMEYHIGQGMEMNWTSHMETPTVNEYFAMVDGSQPSETGSLFVLLAELMRSEATENKDLDLGKFMKFFSRFFQAQDDYQNFQGAEYVKEKGFSDDCGDGKPSLPLIHALNSKLHRGRLLSILQQRKVHSTLSTEVRKLYIDDIKASGGLKYARGIIEGLQDELERILATFEHTTGTKNWILRLVQKRLEI